MSELTPNQSVQIKIKKWSDLGCVKPFTSELPNLTESVWTLLRTVWISSCFSKSEPFPIICSNSQFLLINLRKWGLHGSPTSVRYELRSRCIILYTHIYIYSILCRNYARVCASLYIDRSHAYVCNFIQSATWTCSIAFLVAYVSHIFHVSHIFQPRAVQACLRMKWPSTSSVNWCTCNARQMVFI